MVGQEKLRARYWILELYVNIYKNNTSPTVTWRFNVLRIILKTTVSYNAYTRGPCIHIKSNKCSYFWFIMSDLYQNASYNNVNTHHIEFLSNVMSWILIWSDCPEQRPRWNSQSQLRRSLLYTPMRWVKIRGEQLGWWANHPFSSNRWAKWCFLPSFSSQSVAEICERKLANKMVLYKHLNFTINSVDNT